jgi:hypothetical protein
VSISRIASLASCLRPAHVHSMVTRSPYATRSCASYVLYANGTGIARKFTTVTYTCDLVQTRRKLTALHMSYTKQALHELRDRGALSVGSNCTRASGIRVVSGLHAVRERCIRQISTPEGGVQTCKCAVNAQLAAREPYTLRACIHSNSLVLVRLHCAARSR